MSRRGTSKPISQKERQAMLSVNPTTYQEVKVAADEKRRKAQQKERNSVLDTFLKQVRPKMEVGRAYSLNEMVALYRTAEHHDTAGMFQYLLLNKSDFLNVEHICAMPLHVMVDEVPKNAVDKYADEVENLRRKGILFMEETGMKVELPKPVNERWVKSLYNAAVALERSGECIPAKDWKIGAEEYSYGRAPEPSDFRTMERMGIKFRKIKTVSAFWIDRQF